MAGIRALQRRVAKLEKVAKPRPSPFVVIYGSFDQFVDDAYAGVNEGALDKEFLRILDVLRRWEDEGVWLLAYAR
ncbi:hypothetical protein WG908_10210 [Sphingobium sp. AN641]|uniref:hypothetical protein n=1 Tax=Sphingobium sp. AN641 TaxID=3133443 RepID=UPI0030C308EE